MTTAQLDAVRQHGENLLRIFPDAAEKNPVRLCKKLRALELQAHWLAELMCNEDVGEAGERLAGTLLTKVSNLLNNGEGTGTPSVWFNRDPRGYAFKVSGEYLIAHGLSLHRDWGGDGIVAPKIGRDGN